MGKMLRRRLRRNLRSRLGMVALAVAVSAGLSWWSPQSSGLFERQPPTTASQHQHPQDLTKLLTRVSVINDVADVDGYQRGCKRGQACVFGAAWNDPHDHSGCDTRSRMRRAQLTDVVIKPGTNGCKVLAGRLVDPYTGAVMEYSAGGTSNIDVDHIFSLSRAWDSGAWSWPLAQRIQFANDPDNLLVVSAKANREKSDAGLEWLPDNASFRCTYVIRYLTVAVKYDLPITHDEVVRAKDACPSTTPAAFQ